MAMMSNVHEIQTVYNVVQDPQMVLQPTKSVDCECMTKQYALKLLLSHAAKL